jgi:hypothetical protein
MEKEPEERPGIGVDSHGGAVIDPTKNVEDLVRALEAKTAQLRDADNRFNDAQLAATEKFQDFARGAESKLQTAQRDSETRRIDQLAEAAQKSATVIANMLAESVRTTSDLVSSQLVQIQATFNERVSKLEAFQFTQAGRSSVSDPATSDALRQMAASISSLSSITTETMNKSALSTAESIAKLTVTLSTMQVGDGRISGQKMGAEASNARLLSVVMAVAAVASPVIAIAIMAMRGH